jgi:basic amino acid/polyamine antiporter, APA family
VNLAEVNSHGIQTELSRDLGLPAAMAIGVGTMIAAGIFTLSGLAVAYVGSAAIVAFLLAALVATFTALTYCEFSSIYPESGEGYLYARRTFAPPMAYMVGWCLLMGYTSSCAFYIASFSTYFSEFIWHTPFQQISGLVMLTLLTLLNIKGTKESGAFQIAITLSKVLLLVWFIAGGMGHVDLDTVRERFSTDLMMIGSTGAMVFITFFGFSAIAASAGEVREPTKTIPRAIFLSMITVTILYTFVILVMVAAKLTEYTESAMGTVARAFLGPIGGMVIVGGALFSMISASNASIMAGSRVALSMSQLGHLPREIGTINPQTRTPVIAVLLVGATIGGFAQVLPLEELAHFADCVLLVALSLVNVALIMHRRRHPHIERPFRVPLVPLLPILGILANVYLLTRISHFTPVLLASIALVGGFLGFLAWKGAQIPEEALPGEPSRIALERASVSESDFRVLVPIANPANVDPLIDLASWVARGREGDVVALRVSVVPEQLPPSREDALVERERRLLERARARALEHEVPVSALLRIGHSPARAILETARERSCDLLILGWKGHTSTARRILGEVTDAVVNHARSDIMLVKLAPDRGLRRLLLPTAGGEHSIRAQEYAAHIALANDGEITLCSVVAPDSPLDQVDAEAERLLEARSRIMEMTGLAAIDTKVIRHGSVSTGIIRESESFDAVVLGAAGQSFHSQILFGSIPETIVRRAKCSVILVKRHHAVKALFGRVMTE